MKKQHIFNLSLSGLFLAMALLLPFLTGQIPQIGNMLLPMHIPVLLCGIICGPYWGALVGVIAPFLRFAIFGMPQMPTTFTMTFELLTYGLVIGLVYSKLPKNIVSIFISLFSAMIAGRIVWAVASMLIYKIMGLNAFTFAQFISGGFITAVPGIIVQLVLIPTIVIALKRAKVIPSDKITA
ncbi:MAG: ECF transporter S component [Clostridia bacterium]